MSMFMEFLSVSIVQRRFQMEIAAKEFQFDQGHPVMRQLFIFWLFIKAP